MYENLIGQKAFDSWIVKKKIGEGSFGTVFRLEREEFNRKYEAAMKIITVPQSQTEVSSFRSEGMDDESICEYYKSFIEEILGEIDLMTKLKGNTNIVSYEDHKVIEHSNGIGWDIFIRMEYLTSLFDYFKNRAITVRDIIKLGIDICSALEMCQKFNVVHRDIKPENIFVSNVGDFKLGDFGIARTIEKTSGGLSKKGTYIYMAPEIYKGEPYNASVDIYSLGLVLYRFLNNNKMPFYPLDKKGITYNERELALAKRMNGVKLPDPVNGSEILNNIILKACAFDAKNRYSTPTEMKEELLFALNNSLEIYVDNGDISLFHQTDESSEYLKTYPKNHSVDNNDECDSKTKSFFDLPITTDNSLKKYGLKTIEEIAERPELNFITVEPDMVNEDRSKTEVILLNNNESDFNAIDESATVSIETSDIHFELEKNTEKLPVHVPAISENNNIVAKDKKRKERSDKESTVYIRTEEVLNDLNKMIDSPPVCIHVPTKQSNISINSSNKKIETGEDVTERIYTMNAPKKTNKNIVNVPKKSFGKKSKNSIRSDDKKIDIITAILIAIIAFLIAISLWIALFGESGKNNIGNDKVSVIGNDKVPAETSSWYPASSTTQYNTTTEYHENWTEGD